MRATHQRRGRRTLLWCIAVFVGVQFLGGLLLDYRWPQVRFPMAAEKLARLRRLPRSPDIVCLGSSRLDGGFYAGEVQELLRRTTGDTSIGVFNASIPAGDPVTADYMMERLLDEGIKPAVVVVEVSPETLARRNVWLGQHLLRQFTWMDVPQYFDDVCTAGCLNDLLRARLLPLSVHRREICRESYATLKVRSRRLIGSGDRLAAGTAPKDESRKLPPSAEATFKGVRAARKRLADFRIGGSASESLERLIQRCRGGGIQVILVGVPVSTPHRDLYTPEIDAVYRNYLRRLTETYECQFVDYRDRVPDSGFRDNHHVVPSGAVLFSRQLAGEVLAPAWSRVKGQASASLTPDS